MIGVARFSHRIGDRVILDDISFRAGPRELVALIGPNGAGKSTLLRALAGLLPGGAPQPREVAYLAQGTTAAWGLTVAEVAALGRLPHADRNQAAIEGALVACGIAHLRDARIDRISGGEARRAQLARVFAIGAATLLLDEPTADLDPAAAHAIMALLAEQAANGRCVVVVLHALDLALHHAHRMVLLERGRLTADGPPDALLPVAAAAFGLPYGLDPNPRLLSPGRING